MAKSSIAELKQRVMDAETRAGYAEACLECFFTGETPDSASLQQIVLAQWGRKRLDSMRKTPALLSSELSNKQ